MRRFQQVNHLVQDDIFEALFRLLGELGVQANGAGGRIAAAPLGLHLLYEEAADLDVKPWLPSLDQRWDRGLEHPAVPLGHDRLPS